MAINDYTAAIELRRGCLSPAVANDLRYYRGSTKPFRDARIAGPGIGAEEVQRGGLPEPERYAGSTAGLVRSLDRRIVAVPADDSGTVVSQLRDPHPAGDADGKLRYAGAKGFQDGQGIGREVRLLRQRAAPGGARWCWKRHTSTPAKTPQNPQPETVQAPAAEEPKANYFDMRIYAVSLGGLPKTGITSEMLNRARRCEIPLSIYSPVELEQAAAHFDRLACVDPVQLCRQGPADQAGLCRSHLTLALLLQWPSLLDQPLDTEKFEEALHETDMAIAVREDYADALRWRAMLLLRQSYGKCKTESRPFIELAKSRPCGRAKRLVSRAPAVSRCWLPCWPVGMITRSGAPPALGRQLDKRRRCPGLVGLLLLAQCV